MSKVFWIPAVMLNIFEIRVQSHLIVWKAWQTIFTGHRINYFVQYV